LPDSRIVSSVDSGHLHEGLRFDILQAKRVRQSVQIVLDNCMKSMTPLFDVADQMLLKPVTKCLLRDVVRDVNHVRNNVVTFNQLGVVMVSDCFGQAAGQLPLLRLE